MTDAILVCDGVTRRFGALAAVNNLSFAVERGQLFGIAGPNGAGKTTLFNLLSGHIPLTSGTVTFAGERIDGLPPHRVCHRGLVRTFQIPQVFGSGTVLENVLVGAEFGKREGLPSLGFDRAARARADAALARTGLLGRGRMPAHLTTVFEKKKLMLASALAAEPTMLLLDEPFGGLNHGEIDEFMALIRTLHAEGLTIVLIEHVMRALMSLSQRVMIIHHGEKLAEGTPAEISANPDVVRVYLGREAGAA